MKVKTITIFFWLLIMTLAFNGLYVTAETNDAIDELETISYEKLKFEKNMDYLHDAQKVEMKNTIPVKQFNIYFDGRKQLPKRNDVTYLFRSVEREKKSTVTVKTNELQLFSSVEGNKKPLMTPTVEVETASENTLRTGVIVSIIVLGLIILFAILLPKLVGDPNTGKRKVVS